MDRSRISRPIECRDILNAAIGEANHVIPDDVLRDVVEFLDDYERLRVTESWRRDPEPFH